MREVFKRPTPMRGVVLSVLFFGLLAPTQLAVAGECSYECNEGGCSAAGATVTGQGGCKTTSRKECVEDPVSLAVKCTTIVTCETITGACGDFGRPEL